MQSAIEAIAREIGVTPNALAQWRYRGRVPLAQRFRIAEIARTRGLTLTSEHFDSFRQASEEPAANGARPEAA